jgi:predicted RNase H-like nuclease (RuvC/YqgF family)
MDLTRFEVLEKRIKALAVSLDRTQAENRQLRQQVKRLQQTVTARQHSLEQVQRERDGLIQASEAVNMLRQEREVIQDKLRHMLATIEWLEKHTAMSGESQSG